MAKKICIAPGHGGSDAGAIGNGMKEKDINLAVCLQIAHLLEASGVPVVMTRTTDELCDGATTIQQDLENQCRVSNEHNVDVFFSVHTNAGGGHGAETYVYQGSSAYQLALECTEAVGKIMGVHGEPVKYADYWVLKHTEAPALLCEIGYIDSTDAQKIHDNMNSIAKVLADVLIRYCGGSVEAAQAAHETTPPVQTVTASTSQYVTREEVKQMIDAALSELAKQIKG